jgi:hypothetical protein
MDGIKRTKAEIEELANKAAEYYDNVCASPYTNGVMDALNWLLGDDHCKPEFTDD